MEDDGQEISKAELDESCVKKVLRWDKPVFSNIEQVAIFVMYIQASYEDGGSWGKSVTAACMDVYEQRDLYGVGIETYKYAKVRMPDPPVWHLHEQLLLDLFQGVKWKECWLGVRVEGASQTQVAIEQGVSQQMISKRVSSADEAIMSNLEAMGQHELHQ